MANVTQYKILVYGSPEGYQGNRAQITLFKDSEVIGFLRFHDEGMPFPEDERAKDKIIVHLPSAMLGDVVDILRNEKPLELNFRMKRGLFGTSGESVGEGE
jgi:hypothetical protein